MHVYITGYDARSASPKIAANRMSMARLLVHLFTSAGHTVTHAPLEPWEPTLDTYDIVLVGLASPVGLASTYTNNALPVIEHMIETGDKRLRLFVDDPDLGKIQHGHRSAWNRRDQDPLNAVGHARQWVTSEPKVKELLYGACFRLSHGAALQDVPVLLPINAFWGNAEKIARGYFPNVRGIDLSNQAMGLAEAMRAAARENGRANVWHVEAQRAKTWAMSPDLGLDRYRITHAYRTVAERLRVYENVMGVLESTPAPKALGWWTPTASLAVVSGAGYFTDTTDIETDLSESTFGVEPRMFEMMQTDVRAAFVKAQRAEIALAAPTTDTLLEEITRDT